MESGSASRIRQILNRAEEGRGLRRGDLEALLRLPPGDLREELFAVARRLRHRFFGSGVFLYGFLYASTYCRNDCQFCLYRRSNTQCRRYRKEPEQLLSIARRLADSGVHLLDLTMGEDPFFLAEPDLSRLAELVRGLCAETGLPVMVSPGLVPASGLAALREAGARWYALYQETHNPSLFANLRSGQDYQSRWQAKLEARRLGFLIEEGILCGVGEEPRDLANSIRAMRRLDADQLRAMSFVPQQGIPLAQRYAPDSACEMLAIAVMRLSFPDRLIPATLDVEGLAGLQPRMAAGANVVTSLVPPDQGLSGVAQAELDIEAGGRTAESVRRALEAGGLHVARQEEYASYLERRQDARADAGNLSGSVGEDIPG